MANQDHNKHGHDHSLEDAKTFKIIIAVTVLLVGAAIGYKYYKHGLFSYNLDKIGNSECVKEVQEVSMRDDNLKGIVDKGQKLKIAVGWYACNPIKRGDLAAFHRNGVQEPYVKVVRGIPGDKFSVFPDRSKKGMWNLTIDGDLLTYKGQAFYFGDGEEPALKRYEKDRNGVLRSNESILMSTIPPGDFDSTTRGANYTEDLIGKVIEIDNLVAKEASEQDQDKERAPAEEENKEVPHEAEQEAQDAKVEAVLPEEIVRPIGKPNLPAKQQKAAKSLNPGNKK